MPMWYSHRRLKDTSIIFTNTYTFIVVPKYLDTTPLPEALQRKLIEALQAPCPPQAVMFWPHTCMRKKQCQPILFLSPSRPRRNIFFLLDAALASVGRSDPSLRLCRKEGENQSESSSSPGILGNGACARGVGNPKKCPRTG